MPMITCPDCGNPISKAALACPKCGSPTPLAVAVSKLKRMSKRWRTYSILICCFGLAVASTEWFQLAHLRMSSIGMVMLFLGLLGIVASAAAKL